MQFEITEQLQVQWDVKWIFNLIANFFINSLNAIYDAASADALYGDADDVCKL